MLEKQGQTTHGHGRPEKSSIHPFCADTGYRLVSLLRAMVDKDWWWERENIKGIRNAFNRDDDDDDDDDSYKNTSYQVAIEVINL